MSWVFTPVRKHSASDAEARTGNTSLVPTALEVKRSKRGISPSPQSPILSQLTKDMDGVRGFHLEKLRLHREIDNTIRCYAGLAWHGSKISPLLPRMADQVLSAAPIATRVTLRRKRAATSLRDLNLDSPSKDPSAGIGEYMSPESLEAVDKDFLRWAHQEGISDIISGDSCRNSLDVTRPAPSDQMTFGPKALRDYRITYPEKFRRFSGPVSPTTVSSNDRDSPVHNRHKCHGWDGDHGGRYAQPSKNFSH